MIRKVSYESQERREAQVLAALNAEGIKSLEEANEICEAAGVDPYQMCEDTQRICFENAKWAYVAGAAIAIKRGVKTAADAAEAIGVGLQAFCIPGSVADDRKVGLGHGNLAARLLREETQCFAFLAGHESFAAAEGAIKIAEMANKVRKNPLRVILNGLGKDAAQIISRINGFTYVKTEFDYYTGELKVVDRIAYSDGPRAKVNCYGANDVREGVAINWSEDVDVSITGNSTNPTRFQHPVAGTYKKERILAGKPYFSVASADKPGYPLIREPQNLIPCHKLGRKCVYTILFKFFLHINNILYLFKEEGIHSRNLRNFFNSVITAYKLGKFKQTLVIGGFNSSSQHL